MRYLGLECSYVGSFLGEYMLIRSLNPKPYLDP